MEITVAQKNLVCVHLEIDNYDGYSPEAVFIGIFTDIEDAKAKSIKACEDGKWFGTLYFDQYELGTVYFGSDSTRLAEIDIEEETIKNHARIAHAVRDHSIPPRAEYYPILTSLLSGNEVWFASNGEYFKQFCEWIGLDRGTQTIPYTKDFLFVVTGLVYEPDVCIKMYPK